MKKKQVRIRLYALLSITFSLLILYSTFEMCLRHKREAWPFEKAMVIPAEFIPEHKSLRWKYSHAEGRNSLGLRNREIGQKKDRFRILFLGDSLVFDSETTSGLLYTQVVEERLNKENKGKRKIEIINAGIPGYTTYQELEFLKVHGLDMNPDLVILGFVFNDLYYKYLHKPAKKKALTFDPDIYLNRFDVNAFPGFFFSRSHLAHTIAWRLEILVKKIKKQPLFPFDYHQGFLLAWKNFAWKKENDLIAEMLSLLGEKDIKLMIVVFPISNQVDNRFLKIDREYVLFPQKKIGEMCKSYGIPFLDLTEALYRGGGPRLFKDFLHLSPEGNDIAAREITGFLLKTRPYWYNHSGENEAEMKQSPNPNIRAGG